VIKLLINSGDVEELIRAQAAHLPTESSDFDANNCKSFDPIEHSAHMMIEPFAEFPEIHL
jgi:hypothetical protein